MVNFLFREGQHVKVKATGEVGTVVYRSTDWTVEEVPFYESDTPRRAGGLMSGAASKAVTHVVRSSR